MVVKIKDIEAYQKELRNDFILNRELSNLSANFSLKCGRGVALANATMITAKHIDFESIIPQQQPNSEQLRNDGDQQLLKNGE